MSSDKQQGFVIYFDALNALNEQVASKQISAEDAFAVVAALGQYAQSGTEPAVGSLSPVASMAYAMMISGVKKSLAKYAEKKKKTREAANARWGKGASERMQTEEHGVHPMQEDAGASERMQTEGIETETDTELKVEVEGKGSTSEQEERHVDLHEQIRKNKLAMKIIEQYRLPDYPSTLDAVLEDLDKHGEDVLDQALRQACNSNSRERLSVNFYRSVLARMTGGNSSRGAPRAAEPAFEQKGGKEYYDGLEVYG